LRKIMFLYMTLACSNDHTVERMVPAGRESLCRRRIAYFAERLFAAFLMISATACGCETYTA
jgi:hypothetical protein